MINHFQVCLFCLIFLLLLKFFYILSLHTFLSSESSSDIVWALLLLLILITQARLCFQVLAVPYTDVGLLHPKPNYKQETEIICLETIWLDHIENIFFSMILQQEDLVLLGKLILALACYSMESIQRESIQNSIDFVARNYSSDLKTLIW